MKYAACVLLVVGVHTLGALSEERAFVEKHVMVYYEQGRFGGWPANHGIWSWGNEILVGYTAGYYKDQGPGRHAIDREKPRRDLPARSLDGDETWTIEEPASKGFLIPQAQASDSPGNIDFTHQNAIRC